MLAMKVSLTKKYIKKQQQIMDKCQFGCGILKMVGPKMQDFCPRINMLKDFFNTILQLIMVCQKVPKSHFQMSKFDRFFSRKKSFKNINLGEHFLLLTFFDNFFFLIVMPNF